MFATVVGGAFGATPSIGANAPGLGLAPGLAPVLGLAPSLRATTPSGGASISFEQSIDALHVLAAAAAAATAYFPPAVATLAGDPPWPYSLLIYTPISLL